MTARVLPRGWTFYHREKTPKTSNYFSGTKETAQVNTAEQFWQVYTHLKPFNQLTTLCENQVFLTGVQPLWEDPHNADGGRWTLRIKRSRLTGETPEYLEKYEKERLAYDGAVAALIWERLLVSVVGGQFSKDRVFNTQEVLGLVGAARREEFVISVWNRTASDAAVILALREAILQVTEADLESLNATLEYSPHSDSLTKATVKPRRPRGTRTDRDHRDHRGDHRGEHREHRDHRDHRDHREYQQRDQNRDHRDHRDHDRSDRLNGRFQSHGLYQQNHSQPSSFGNQAQNQHSGSGIGNGFGFGSTGAPRRQEWH